MRFRIRLDVGDMATLIFKLPGVNNYKKKYVYQKILKIIFFKNILCL